MAASLNGDTPTPSAAMMPADLQVSIKVEQGEGVLHDENDDASSDVGDSGRGINNIMQFDSNYHPETENRGDDGSSKKALESIDDFHKNIQIKSEPPIDINDCHDNVIGDMLSTLRPNTHSPVIRLTPTQRLMPTPNASNPKRKYECPYSDCTKSYGKSSHLRSHLTWHTGIKPFVCQAYLCGKGFTRSDELNRHVRTHTGEKPFQCLQCSKKFSRSDHLTKHSATHSKSTKFIGPAVNGGGVQQTTPRKPRLSKITPMVIIPTMRSQSPLSRPNDFAKEPIPHYPATDDFVKDPATDFAKDPSIDHENDLAKDPDSDFAKEKINFIKSEILPTKEELALQRKYMRASAAVGGVSTSPLHIMPKRHVMPMSFSPIEMMQSPSPLGGRRPIADFSKQPTNDVSEESTTNYSEGMHFLDGLMLRRNESNKESHSGRTAPQPEQQKEHFQISSQKNLTFGPEKIGIVKIKYEIPEESEDSYQQLIVPDMERVNIAPKMYIKTEQQQRGYNDRENEEDEPDDDAIMPEANLPPLPLAIINAANMCSTPPTPSTPGSLLVDPPPKKIKKRNPDNGLRPWTCKDCPKTFKRQDDLNRHLRTHTGEKPFHCNECEKRFMRSDHLKKHMNIHTRIRRLPATEHPPMEKAITLPFIKTGHPDMDQTTPLSTTERQHMDQTTTFPLSTTKNPHTEQMNTGPTSQHPPMGQRIALPTTEHSHNDQMITWPTTQLPPMGQRITMPLPTTEQGS